jgi:hypothetical protein
MELSDAEIGGGCGDNNNVEDTESVHGAWYAVIGTGGVLKLSMCSRFTDFRATIGVYTGECNQDNTARDLVCEKESQVDPDCDGATVTWLSTAGEVYYAFVRSLPRFSGGNFVLNLTAVEEPLRFDVFQNHAYAISAKLYTASQARGLLSTTNGYKVCGKRTELVAVTSQPENDFIAFNVMDSPANDFLLLGGFQDPEVMESTAFNASYGQGWSWINEGTFPALNTTDADNDYQNWDVGEPDQRPGFGEEDCLAMYTGNGKWHDRTCDSPEFPFRFVIEADLTRTRPVTIGNCDTGLSVDPLISVESGEENSYNCAFLSDAIAGLVDEGTTDGTSKNVTTKFLETIDSLLDSPQLEGTLSEEQMTAIKDCAASLVD